MNLKVIISPGRVSHITAVKWAQLYSLHELERYTSTPRQLQTFIKRISKHNIIRRICLQEPAYIHGPSLDKTNENGFSAAPWT